MSTNNNQSVNQINNTPVKTVTQESIRLASINETKGRKYFQQIVNSIFPDYQEVKFSDLHFSRWDSAVLMKDGTKYLIEIKCREMNSNKYSDYMIESEKYEYLMNQINNGYTPIYVNFFWDNTCLVWNLEEQSEIGKKEVYCNKATVNPNAGKKWSVKNMFLASNAKRHTYQR